MTTLRRLLQRSRPRFWLYLAGPALVGAAYGANSVTALVSPSVIALVGYFLLPANIYLYGVNDVFDAEVDRENPKKGDRELRYEGSFSHRIGIVCSGLLGVVIAVFIPQSAPWIVAFLVLGYAYSAPPRLKTTPPLDSISNGLYVFPGVATYVVVTGSLPPLLAILGAWFWTMGMHTFSAIPDIDPDHAAGIRTMATSLGRRWSLAYCGVCWVLAALAFGRLDVRLGGLLIVYPALVFGIEIWGVPLDRAYWWYPAINGLVGMTLTVGGLWVTLGA